ncbi:Dor1-like family protein [Oesophagostomum dentatum]|uniref:Conserved oligomeric Golgi complex subunit 8 n=1 Tax=Oesophagostomum dentatum TaxID=61180 RepID=A0A0B1T8Y8_OESDE|nr:Dor1-like family protein [Oesophagostomum dentatum]
MVLAWRERSLISNDLKSLQDQIGDLAFNNYRTYADAGRTTQHCTEIFTEMKDKLRLVSGEIPELATELRDFHARTKDVCNELETVRSACQKDSPVWELLSLPSRMDVCIRAGYYEAAYSLTNYGMMLQQHSVIKNPLIKSIADKLVEARSFLLEELFNKFSGPLDLASSIQVVNNVRKMPYLTPTQLRVCILQHRDIYLDRQILDITNHPEFAIRAIEIYRDCMYDTLVLYLAVFPENEATRKDLSLDPRWETWPSSAPSSVLGQWTARNITRLLDLIRRADMKSSVDMCTVWSKLMSLAASLGRMGLDFRALVVDSLVKIVLERFSSAVRTATNTFLNDTKVLAIASGELSSLSLGSETNHDSSKPPQPSPEVSMWDDICVYGNAIVEALNGLRYTPSPVLESFTELGVRDLIASCTGCERIQAVLDELSRARTVPDLEILNIPDKDTAAAENPPSQANVPSAISDTSVCSPPEQESSSIHFEVGDDGDDSSDVKVESVADDSSVIQAASQTKQELETSPAEAEVELPAADDVPALVETAPTPPYSYVEESAVESSEWGWGEDAVEEESAPSRAKE